MAVNASASTAMAGETASDETASGESTCAELGRIASDFHALMIAHCPLCNGMGPQCIVESMEEALAGVAPEPDTEEAGARSVLRQ
jgi:hypothetical protein